jgi:ATP-dependent protease ClpP protease subunit
MSKPDYDYRIRPDRSLYVVGDFDDTLLKEIIPRITEFRFKSDKPIGIVIDSRGGSSDCLDAILAALSVHNPDGKQSRVITCAMGLAASAGATLLALGDYAIATPSSSLHFHGTRTIPDDVIRMEDARRLADMLATRNQEISRRMRHTMIVRIVHRFVKLRSRIDELIQKNPKLPFLTAYIMLATKRTSSACDKIFENALTRVAEVKRLFHAVRNVNFRPKDSPGSLDLKVFNKVLTFHKRNSKAPVWHLNPYTLPRIVSDFLILRSYRDSITRPTRLISENIQMYGIDFLRKPEAEKYRKIRSKKKKRKFLEETVLPQIQEFWYFAEWLADLLLFGENRITAIDAYWLGIVDEIQGDPEHYGVRAIVEANP